MNIGFDAKRYFFNRSGLGAYSRNTIDLLLRHLPQHRYTLFTPHPDRAAPPRGVEVAGPSGVCAAFPSLWRSFALGRSLRGRIDLYHGLSNELPADIARSGAASAVTVHDLIFVRYPRLYSPLDTVLYTRKYRQSCLHADCIVAVSRQTRDDLVELWGIPPERIRVIYQGCHPRFRQPVAPELSAAVRGKYRLPQDYLLSVGTLEERKNLLTVLEAMHIGRIDIPLVACGRRTPYADRMEKYAAAHGLSDRLLLLDRVGDDELPALYRGCRAFVYPSLFEGFGIPILEALCSHAPVITTRGGVFGETGGDACRYVDCRSPEEMAVALDRVLTDSALRRRMTRRGIRHAELFRDERIARRLAALYDQLAP